MENKESEKNKKKETIDYAILLTCIPPLTYFLQFLYNIGKLTYYNIPYSFVDLGISGNITTLIKILALVIPIFLFTIYEYSKNKKIKTKAQEIKEAILEDDSIADNCKQSIIDNKIYEARKPTKKENIFMICLFILSSISIFYLRRYSIIMFFSSGVLGITTLISNFILSRWYSQGKIKRLLSVSSALLIAITVIFGYLDQFTNHTYTIVNYKKGTYVSFVMYNNQFIIAPLNKDKHLYQNKFKIIDPKDADNFWNENLGYILPQKK